MTWRLAESLDVAAWRAALSSASAFSGPDSRELKREGENWVRRVTWRIAGGEFDVIVKRRVARGTSEVVKMLLGGSRFARHWRGANWLLANGFLTGRPMALGRRIRGATIEEILIVEFVPGRTVLEHLAANDLTVRRQHAAARELGRMVARLAERGRFNRDSKPSNLVLTGDERIAILDTVAIRRRGPLGKGRDGGMLASLVIEPIGTGNRPRRTLMMRVIRAWIDAAAEQGVLGAGPLDARARHTIVGVCWRDLDRLVTRHGDPRPRTDPLR